jgi:hypothetical protein
MGLFTLRRLARDGERETFHGPEEAALVVVEAGWAVLRCERETTALAARRRGFVDVVEPLVEPLVEPPATAPSRRKR